MSKFLILITCVISSDSAKVLPTYKGKLLGVKASVVLDRNSRVAKLELSGIPICGKISGKASFSPSGEVELDSKLTHELKRRFVFVTAAGENQNEDTVWVEAELPLNLGKHKIILRRCKK